MPGSTRISYSSVTPVGMVFIPVAGSMRHSAEKLSTSVDMAMVPTSCFKPMALDKE
jgi:hypothetical protein